MKRLAIYLLIATIFITSCDKNGSTSSADKPTGTSGSTGQGGSLARFTIAMDYLYVVDNQKLYAYSLANSANPQLKSSTDVGFNVETIYSYQDKLFIGSSNAMYVYSLADAGHPAKLGQASHVRACDPVVANDSLAYVTVRSTTSCGGNTNALMVYDIKYIMQPVLRNTVPVSSPWGLGIKGDRLYVCNGSAGLNIYDISKPLYPSLLKQLPGETFYDVIVYNNLLICMIQGGTGLYNLGANDEITLLAKITN